MRKTPKSTIISYFVIVEFVLLVGCSTLPRQVVAGCASLSGDVLTEMVHAEFGVWYRGDDREYMIPSEAVMRRVVKTVHYRLLSWQYDPESRDCDDFARRGRCDYIDEVTDLCRLRGVSTPVLILHVTTPRGAHAVCALPAQQVDGDVKWYVWEPKMGYLTSADVYPYTINYAR